MKAYKPISRIQFIAYRNYRMIHGIRIAIGFVCTFLLVWILNIPEGSWPLITLIVVMGPISFWGNVFPRAIQRIGGTIFGAISGLIALKIELISLPGMLLWCALIIFISGFLTLGKHSYMALLIGITLAVICGGIPRDIITALWRAGDVVIGSILALLFTSIWPQKAYTHWRIQLSDILLEIARIYHAGFSLNLVEKPRLSGPLQKLLSNVIKLRSFIIAASKETRIPRSVFEAIQILNRNLVCTLELQLNAWWISRHTHLILLKAIALRNTQKMTENTLRTLSKTIINGNINNIHANSEELNVINQEMKELIAESDRDDLIETPIHGYIWLSLEMVRQLAQLSELIRLAMRE